jgi:hypothetical protein
MHFLGLLQKEGTMQCGNVDCFEDGAEGRHRLISFEGKDSLSNHIQTPLSLNPYKTLQN